MQSNKKTSTIEIGDVDYSNVDQISITYTPSINPNDRITINGSEMAYRIFLTYWGPHLHYKETLKVLFLNTGNSVLGVQEVSSGGADSCTIDPRSIFQSALKAHATGIIIAHNHPSGKTRPSKADKDVTSIISRLGKYLGIKLLDHIILGYDSYYSFSDDHLL